MRTLSLFTLTIIYVRIIAVDYTMSTASKPPVYREGLKWQVKLSAAIIVTLRVKSAPVMAATPAQHARYALVEAGSLSIPMLKSALAAMAPAGNILSIIH